MAKDKYELVRVVDKELEIVGMVDFIKPLFDFLKGFSKKDSNDMEEALYEISYTNMETICFFGIDVWKKEKVADIQSLNDLETLFKRTFTETDFREESIYLSNVSV